MSWLENSEAAAQVQLSICVALKKKHNKKKKHQTRRENPTAVQRCWCQSGARASQAARSANEGPVCLHAVDHRGKKVEILTTKCIKTSCLFFLFFSLPALFLTRASCRNDRFRRLGVPFHFHSNSSRFQTWCRLIKHQQDELGLCSSFLFARSRSLSNLLSFFHSGLEVMLLPDGT